MLFPLSRRLFTDPLSFTYPSVLRSLQFPWTSQKILLPPITTCTGSGLFEPSHGFLNFFFVALITQVIMVC